MGWSLWRVWGLARNWMCERDSFLLFGWVGGARGLCVRRGCDRCGGCGDLRGTGCVTATVLSLATRTWVGDPPADRGLDQSSPSTSGLWNAREPLLPGLKPSQPEASLAHVPTWRDDARLGLYRALVGMCVRRSPSCFHLALRRPFPSSRLHTRLSTLTLALSHAPHPPLNALPGLCHAPCPSPRPPPPHPRAHTHCCSSALCSTPELA